jgi:glutamine amidotransferase
MKVGIINYGVGNLGSVTRAVEAVGGDYLLINRAEDINVASCFILPGVGSFSDCVKLLDSGSWMDSIQQEVLGAGKPLLGICLGMQLLASVGFEGTNGEPAVGLNLIPGRVVGLRDIGCSARVPHVGWNDIKRLSSSTDLFAGIPDKTDFYFVHSFTFVPDDERHVAAVCEHEVPVTAAVRNKHIWGVQFHPEKSSRAGFQTLRNFLDYSEC